MDAIYLIPVTEDFIEITCVFCSFRLFLKLWNLVYNLQLLFFHRYRLIFDVEIVRF